LKNQLQAGQDRQALELDLAQAEATNLREALAQDRRHLAEALRQVADMKQERDEAVGERDAAMREIESLQRERDAALAGGRAALSCDTLLEAESTVEREPMEEGEGTKTPRETTRLTWQSDRFVHATYDPKAYDRTAVADPSWKNCAGDTAEEQSEEEQDDEDDEAACDFAYEGESAAEAVIRIARRLFHSAWQQRTSELRGADNTRLLPNREIVPWLRALWGEITGCDLPMTRTVAGRSRLHALHRVQRGGGWSFQDSLELVCKRPWCQLMPRCAWDLSEAVMQRHSDGGDTTEQEALQDDLEATRRALQRSTEAFEEQVAACEQMQGEIDDLYRRSEALRDEAGLVPESSIDEESRLEECAAETHERLCEIIQQQEAQKLERDDLDARVIELELRVQLELDGA